MAAPPVPEDFTPDADEPVPDFIVSDDDVEVEPLVEPPADGEDVLPLVEPPADGDDVLPLVEPPAEGELDFVSVPVAEGELPELEPLVPPVPALLEESLELLPEPLGPCASAGAAANARATVSANAPVNVF